MFCKDVVVVFAEIALLGVVDVGKVGSEDRKFLVNGGEVRVGRGCGSVGSIGRVGRVGSRKGSVGRVGAASKEEKDTRTTRRRSKELREPWECACNEGIVGQHQWTLMCWQKKRGRSLVPAHFFRGD